MNVGSRNNGVAGRLSNFTSRKFSFQGVECASLEGVLQSFKSPYPEIQIEICKLSGFKAKKRGSSINWKTKQVLHWQGRELPRKSKEYQELLNELYQSCYDDERSGLKKDLDSVQREVIFSHSIGKRKESDTVLTEREFCRRLQALHSGLCLTEPDLF